MGLFDFFFSKPKKDRSKEMMVCPKCRSTDVEPDFSATAYGEGSLFNKYKCNNCGYAGQFFPKVARKQAAKKKKT